jgi:hypothetical protein
MSKIGHVNSGLLQSARTRVDDVVWRLAVAVVALRAALLRT